MDRVRLKNNAKAILRKHYLALLIVSFIVAVVGGNSSGNFGAAAHSNPHGTNMEYRIDTEIREFVQDNDVLEYGTDVVSRSVRGLPLGRLFNMFLGFGIALISIAIACAAIFFVIFVAFPVNVGGARIYIDSADGEHEPLLSRLAFSFRSGHYMNIVKAGFLKGLYEFLWSLLFVIPGIVKGYGYRMTRYILADSPDLSASDAIRLSDRMMQGHKMELFMLDLSFIGWYILGGLAFGVGVFLVHPYKDATEAQFYMTLRSAYVTAGPETATDTHGYVQ
jgi:uncharacterized membrane protein